MIGTAAALLGSAAIGAGASIYGANKASKASKDAAAQQSAGIEQGINQSQPYYEQGQNFLAPYVQGGQESSELMNDIIGLNGPEKQQRALGMYQSSPSANLLKQAQEEALRQTAGKWASGGGWRSGGAIQDLARRQSDLSLGDYYNWQGLGQGLYNTGANAAGQASNLASGRGNTILGARTGQGLVNASGTIGSANAQLGGMFGANNYLQNFLGKAGQNDWLSQSGGMGTGGGKM
jgi:hypothetical protein